MLHEQDHVRQIPEEHLHRRYFDDEKLDLVFWYRPEGTLYGFQMTYEAHDESKALTWIEDRGYAFARVDYGDDGPLGNPAAILRPGGTCDIAEVSALFEASATGLPADLAEVVRQKIGAYHQPAVR